MNNKNSSVLRQNLIFNIIYQVVVVLSPLAVTPKLSRILGADYIGLKSFTFSIVYYFAIFGVLGLDMYGQRRIAQVKDDKEKRSRLFLTIATLRAVLCLISIGIYMLSFVLVTEDPFMRGVYLCWVVYLIREMINPVWYLQGTEKYRVVSVLSTLSQLVYVAAVFFFVNSRSDIEEYILYYTVIPLATSICFIPIVLKDIQWVRIRIRDWVEIFKESFVYFVPTIATAVYSMLDKTMLGVFDPSKVSTGIYEQAEKLVKVALAFSTASFTIMRTRMSYLYENANKDEYDRHVSLFVSFSMFLCWPIMFGIIGITKDFVPLFFGPGYDAVVGLSYVFSLVIIPLTISGLLQAVYVFPQGHQKSMNLYYVIISALNFVLNMCLIPLLGGKGAVIASITAEVTLAIILLRKARRAIRIELFFIKSIKYFISGVVMCGGILLLSDILPLPKFYKLVAEVFVGVLIYGVMCLLLHDSFVWGQVDKMCGILKKKTNRNG